MPNWDPQRFAPGTSVLGGAAAGLSYEGCLRDAMAREERRWQREEGRTRRVPPPQSQTAWREPARVPADLAS